MEPARKRKVSKVSDAYLRAMTELHDALVDASDDDAIDDKEDALTDIDSKESPDLDDECEADGRRPEAGRGGAAD